MRSDSKRVDAKSLAEDESSQRQRYKRKSGDTPEPSRPSDKRPTQPVEAANDLENSKCNLECEAKQADLPSQMILGRGHNGRIGAIENIVYGV